MRGYRACTALIRRARYLTPSDSAAPMWMSPPLASPRALHSSSVLSTMSRISSARLRRSIPSSVSRTLKLPQTKSFFPSSPSRSLSCLDRVGWERRSPGGAGDAPLLGHGEIVPQNAKFHESTSCCQYSGRCYSF